MIVCLLQAPADQALAMALGTLRKQTVRFNSIDPLNETIFVDEHSFHVLQQKNFKEVILVANETFIEENLPSKFFSSFVLRKATAINPVVWAEQYLWSQDFDSKSFWPHRKTPSFFHIDKTSEKEGLLAQVYELANKMNLPPRVANLAVTTADELLLNAFFDAPVDQALIPRFKSMNRALPLTSPEPITLAMEVYQEHLIIAVVDNYGSLNRESLINHLARGYRRHYQPSSASTGAGIGISTMLQRGVSFIYKTHRQHFTQVLGLIKITEGYKKFQENSNFFITQIKNT